MLALAERGCESRFILIYLFVDEYTHSSQTYWETLRRCEAAVKSGQVSGERQHRNEMMSKRAVTVQPKPSASLFFIDDSVELVNNERHLHSPPEPQLHSESLRCHHHGV